MLYCQYVFTCLLYWPVPLHGVKFSACLLKCCSLSFVCFWHDAFFSPYSDCGYLLLLYFNLSYVYHYINVSIGDSWSFCPCYNVTYLCHRLHIFVACLLYSVYDSKGILFAWVWLVRACGFVMCRTCTSVPCWTYLSCILGILCSLHNCLAVCVFLCVFVCYLCTESCALYARTVCCIPCFVYLCLHVFATCCFYAKNALLPVGCILHSVHTIAWRYLLAIFIALLACTWCTFGYMACLWIHPGVFIALLQLGPPLSGCVHCLGNLFLFLA